MDTFDSFWEMDSDKKLNRSRCWRDDNSSTFFLRKVELKMIDWDKSIISITYEMVLTPYLLIWTLTSAILMTLSEDALNMDDSDKIDKTLLAGKQKDIK
jgi:hypothetical protein